MERFAAGLPLTALLRELRGANLQHAFDSEWGGVHGIPSYWVEQTPESVREEMKGHSSITMEELEAAAATLRAEVRLLHADTCIALAPVRNQRGFEREVALLDDLEAIEFERSARSIAHALAPKQQMTRDSLAANQGIHIPAHLLLRGRMIAARVTAKATEDFLAKSDRLLRQVQTQLTSVTLGERVRQRLQKARWLGRLANHPWVLTVVGGSITALFGAVIALWLA